MKNIEYKYKYKYKFSQHDNYIFKPRIICCTSYYLNWFIINQIYTMKYRFITKWISLYLSDNTHLIFYNRVFFVKCRLQRKNIEHW